MIIGIAARGLLRETTGHEWTNEHDEQKKISQGNAAIGTNRCHCTFGGR